MKRKGFLLVMVIILVCTGILFAGGQTEKKETGGKAAQKYIIGYNSYGNEVEYFKIVADSVKAAAAKNGVELLYAEGKADSQKCIANVDSFLTRGAQLVIDFNCTPAIGNTLVKMAGAKGIPLISVDVPFEGAYYFGADNEKAAKVAGKYLGDLVKKNWNGEFDYLVLLGADAGGEETMKRVTMIPDGMKEAGVPVPKEKIMYFNCDGDAIKAMNIVTDFFTSKPNAKKVLFGALNDPSASGALSAVEKANRSKDSYIISFGAETGSQENFRKGVQNAWVGSVAFTPEKYGDFLIPYAIEIIEDLKAGKEPPKRKGPEHFVIDYSNVNKVYPKE